MRAPLSTGNPVDHESIDQVQSQRRVDPMTDPLHVAPAWDRHVERWTEAVAVEAVERGRGGPARPDVATDVEHQCSEVRERRGRRTGESERVRADLEEGTARDSAPKLCVGHANAVRLPP